MHEKGLSGSAGQRITKILEAATAAAEEHRRRISTATINMVVRDTVNWRQPPTLARVQPQGPHLLRHAGEWLRLARLHLRQRPLLLV